MLNFTYQSVNPYISGATVPWRYAGLIASKSNSFLYGLIVCNQDIRIQGEEYGNTILTHIKEEYLYNENENKLEKLQQILTSVYQKIVDSTGVSIVLIELLSQDEKIPLTLCGHGLLGCRLWHNKTVFVVPVDEKGIEGFLYKEDLLLLGTNIIFQTIPAQDISQLFLNKDNVNSVIEKTIKAKLDMLLATGLVINVNDVHKRSIAEKITSFLKKKKKREETYQPVYLEEKRSFLTKKRWQAMVVAAIFLILLGFSIGIGMYKRKTLEKAKQDQQLVENITYRLEQAESLKNLNPSRAKTLLSEARRTLESYQAEGMYGTKLEELKTKLDAVYAEVAGQHIIRQPEIFYNLLLVKENFVPTNISLTDNDLALFDKDKKLLVILNIETKSAQIIAGSDNIQDESFMGSIADWVFLASQDSLQIIDKQTKKQLNSFSLSKIKINALVGYGNNAYILDKNMNKVWRLRGIKNGLAAPENFFQEEQDIKNVVGMTLDGSLWLLYEDGGVEKYTSGIKDAYYPSFNLDLPLNKPQEIYTDENSSNLFILDKNNNRIVSISKNGEYQAEYQWEEMAKISGFVGSQSLQKLLVVSGSTIYGIPLK